MSDSDREFEIVPLKMGLKEDILMKGRFAQTLI